MMTISDAIAQARAADARADNLRRMAIAADVLAAEVERLRAEVERLRAAIAGNICPECQTIDEEDAYAAADAAGGKR